MDTFDVAVVGAGHNGLACAALLAKSGLRVAVFECRDRIGGASVSERDVWPGYTVSAASYVVSLLDPWLIDTLELRSHGYDAYRKLPWEFTPLLDGRSMLLGVSDENDAAEISRFDVRDVAGFNGFEERVARLGRALFDTFSDEEPRFDGFDDETRAMLEGSAAELVERYVRTPVLQAGLVNDGLVGTYLGPRNRGTGYVLAHHNAGRAMGEQGAWGYVRGGMGSIAQALASAAQRYGAQIFSDARVERILTYDRRVTGVLLEDGRDIAARAVASNAHPRITFLNLLDGGVLDGAFADKVREWKTNGPCLKLNLALGELPNFTARPGTNAAAASQGDDSPSTFDRLSSGRIRRCRRTRRKPGAADRMFLTNADGPDARAKRQTHPVDFRAVLSVRSRGWMEQRRKGARRRQDRRYARPARAEFT